MPFDTPAHPLAGACPISPPPPPPTKRRAAFFRGSRSDLSLYLASHGVTHAR